jgi:hypothetical protein
LLALIFVHFLVAVPPIPGNLLVNGDFEEGPATEYPITPDNSTAQNFPGWQVVYNSFNTVDEAGGDIEVVGYESWGRISSTLVDSSV